MSFTSPILDLFSRAADYGDYGMDPNIMQRIEEGDVVAVQTFDQLFVGLVVGVTHGEIIPFIDVLAESGDLYRGLPVTTATRTQSVFQAPVDMWGE